MSEKFIVLDTETTNSLDDALVYDIGFIVADYDGNIYEKHSYTIADTFLDSDLMSTAFFAEKIPQYWEDIKNGTRQLRKLSTVKFILRNVIKRNNITKIYAFNVKFDYNALLTTERYFTSSQFRYFLPYGMEIHDILKLARHSLKNDSDYRSFCLDNGYVDSRNHNRHTAEIVTRFLFNENFIESHTGLEDSEIEYKILLAFHDGEYNTKLW